MSSSRISVRVLLNVRQMLSHSIRINRDIVTILANNALVSHGSEKPTRNAALHRNRGDDGIKREAIAQVKPCNRLFFFFFQAEDGIRDYKVTGVQTCALPISAASRARLVPRIAVAATAPFGADVLERLAERHEVVAVLTRPDRPRGRGRRTAPPQIGRAACRERG